MVNILKTPKPNNKREIKVDFAEPEPIQENEKSLVEIEKNLTEFLRPLGVGVVESNLDHGSLSGLTDDDHTQYSLISSAAGIPTSTPTRVGEIYVDTTNGHSYISTGTTGATDWKKAGNMYFLDSEFFNHRIKITIDNTLIPSTQTDFEVAVNLSDLGTDFFQNVNTDGRDIRLTNSSGTLLPVDLVTIDTSAETGEIHFKADSISSSTDTVFYIYYDSDGAEAPAVADTNGRNNVWTAYEMVQHNDTLSYIDSTGNGNTGTNTNTVLATGVLGNSADFNGTDNIDYGDNANLKPTDAFTISAWVNITDDSTDQAIFTAGITSVDNDGYDFWFLDGGSFLIFRIGNGASTTKSLSVGTGIYTGWHHVVARWDGTNMNIYYDGTKSTNTAKASITYDTDTVQAGNFTNYSMPMLGQIDEIRFVKGTALADDTITTQYNNQNSPSTFYTIGAQETA